MVDQGSPYGAERRSGKDDRQCDRRGPSHDAAGIGLTRDYFSQADARVNAASTGLKLGDLIRFHE